MPKSLVVLPTQNISVSYGNAARRQDLPAVVVDDRAHLKLAARAVQALDRTLAKAEAMPVRDREVIDVVRGRIHAAGGDLVQQRLPHVGFGAIDQRHRRLAASGELVAQRGRQRQAAGAAADDDDAVRPAGMSGFLVSHPGPSLRAASRRRHASRCRGAR